MNVTNNCEMRICKFVVYTIVDQSLSLMETLISRKVTEVSKIPRYR